MAGQKQSGSAQQDIVSYFPINVPDYGIYYTIYILFYLKTFASSFSLYRDFFYYKISNYCKV